jgi:hypothetical protein
MPKAKKLPKITTLRNKLDREFNSFIVERDKACILTGDKKGLQCSHFYEKKACPFLRWDERNAHAMANRKGNAIHFKHHHGRDPDYSIWMIQHYGMGFVLTLQKDSLKKIVYTREMLMEKIAYYQAKRKAL